MGHKVSETYTGGGDWLSAKDLQKKDGSYVQVNVAINDVQLASVPAERGSKEMVQKLVLHFHGKDKCLPLNRTNAQNMAMWFGDDTDAWIGKPIVLGVHQTNFGPGILVMQSQGQLNVGQQVGQLAEQFRPPQPQQRPDPYPMEPIMPDDDFDDDIPF